MSKQTPTISFTALPTLGTALEGGTFEGLTTRKDGIHCAVVLLPDRGVDLNWKKAKAWAKGLGAELPSRPVAAMLFANAKEKLEPQWHWTDDEYDASYAWRCHFGNGYQLHNNKSYEGSAVAVRLIPVTA